MKRNNLLAVILVALSLGACDYQKNNTIVQKDHQAANPLVYGVHPDSSARQLKNKYAEDVESESRTQKIREKLTSGKTIAQGNW